MLRDLGKRQITSVMIEGGGGVLGEAFDRRLVQRAHFYLAPLLCGGSAVVISGLGVGSNAEAAAIRNPIYTRLGDNLRLTVEVVFPAKR